MPGDYSRDTFDPRKHFRSVRLQQGRVLLDAEWNEAEDIQNHLRETGVRDVIGPSGVPQQGGGFRIDVATATPPQPFSFGEQTLVISPGRIYVDGILCELESAPEVPVNASDVSNPPSSAVRADRVAVERGSIVPGAWVEIFNLFRGFGSAVSYARVVDVRAAEGEGPDRREIVLDRALASSRGFFPGLRRATVYTDQPELPGTELPSDERDELGTWFVVLHVWERPVTPLDDPSLLETALGGVDTTLRGKTSWQVELLRVGELGDEDLHCLSAPQAWQERTTPGSGRMRARTRPSSVSEDPCIVPESAGFTGLENQLYRVQIHRKGDRSSATFLFSRENASVERPWTGFEDSNRVLIGSPGRDRVLGFQDGDWIELTDDAREIQGAPGILAKVRHAEDQFLEIEPGTATETIAWSAALLHPRVRRWESGAMPLTGASPQDPWQPLEHSIEVLFEEGTFRTGDYWLIPARAFIGPFAGDIEWPRETVPPHEGLALPPHGVRHHFCRLAVVTVGRGGLSVLSDCRPAFPRLTELTRLVGRCTCDQEALPSEKLPEPIGLAVYNGERPVPDVTVQFTVRGGGTLVRTTGETAGAVLTEKTNESGFVFCDWILGPKYEPQQVTAIRLDAAGRPIGAEECFSARQSVPMLHQLCGDGQETLPGQLFPADLEVVVWVGAQRALPGVRVRFKIHEEGEGFVQALPLLPPGPIDPTLPTDSTLPTLRPLPVNPFLSQVVAITQEDGTASCRWLAGDTKRVQRVEATLLTLTDDPGGEQPFGPPVCFTGMLSLDITIAYVGGDGQETGPGQTLPQPLEVRVANGPSPQLRAFVRFRIIAGDTTAAGLISDFPGAPISDTLVVQTDVDGLAICFWRLDATNPSQRVEAVLLGDGDDGRTPVPGQVVHFNATIEQREEPGIKVLDILGFKDRKPVDNDSRVAVSRLAQGLAIRCSDPLAEEPFNRIDGSSADLIPAKPVCFVIVDLPYPLGGEDVWNTQAAAGAPGWPLGFRPTLLAGSLKVQGSEIHWIPAPAVVNWLNNNVIFRPLKGTDRLLAHLTLKGNFIWQRARPDVFLDGNTFGRHGAGGRVDLILPSSGDRQRGGDFEMWFWLVPVTDKNLDLMVFIGDRVISGVFRNRDGAPFIGAQIILMDRTENPLIAHQLTNEAGEFELSIEEISGFETHKGLLAIRADANGAVEIQNIFVFPPVLLGRVLLDIPGIGEALSNRLIEGGIGRPEELAVAEPARVAKIMSVSEERARGFIEAAKAQIAQK